MIHFFLLFAVLFCTQLSSMELKPDTPQALFCDEIWGEIFNHCSLQSFGRLRLVHSYFRDNIVFDCTENNGFFKYDKICSALVQDYDRCTDALISCAPNCGAHLCSVYGDELLKKHNKVELAARWEDAEWMGYVMHESIKQGDWNYDIARNTSIRGAYEGKSKKFNIIYGGEKFRKPLKEALNENRIDIVKILCAKYMRFFTSEIFKQMSAELINMCYVRDKNRENYHYEAGTLIGIDTVIKKFAILSAYGLDLNTRLKKGRTLLMEACIMSGHAALVEFLLSQGVDVNVQDTYGNTALHETHACSGSEKMIGMLLNCGANPLIRNRRKKIALDTWAEIYILKALMSGIEDDIETAALKMVSLIDKVNITSLSAELINWCYMRRAITQVTIGNIIKMLTIFVAHGLDLNVRLKNNKTLDFMRN